MLARVHVQENHDINQNAAYLTLEGAPDIGKDSIIS